MIASITVLYEPEIEMLKNFDSYINAVDLSIFVDNSECQEYEFLEVYCKNDNCIYIKLNRNVGIAAALNIGIDKAAEHGANYALTMDQDSQFKSGLVNYIDFFKKLDDVALMAPSYKLLTSNKTENKSNENFVMTSGNLLRIKDYYDVGKFDAEFFIDLVDTDFCRKLVEHNKKFEVYNSVELNHSLGSKFKVGNDKFNIQFIYHSPIRNYYFMRNSLVIMKRYPVMKSYVVKENSKRIFKAIIMLDYQSIFLIYKGFWDGRKNKLGKL